MYNMDIHKNIIVATGTIPAWAEYIIHKKHPKSAKLCPIMLYEHEAVWVGVKESPQILQIIPCSIPTSPKEKHENPFTCCHIPYSSLCHVQPIRKISWKSAYPCFRNNANRKANDLNGHTCQHFGQVTKQQTIQYKCNITFTVRSVEVIIQFQIMK